MTNRAVWVMSWACCSLAVIVEGCSGVVDSDPGDSRAGRGGNAGAGGSADGSTATGGSSATGGAGGAAGTGGAIDRCMIPLASKSCSLAGCHAASMASAGLRLTEDVIAQPASLVDRSNAGDPTGCAAGTFKLIDRAEPEKSLLYKKLLSPAPCGAKMPVGPALSISETACVLSWIKSAVR